MTPSVVCETDGVTLYALWSAMYALIIELRQQIWVSVQMPNDSVMCGTVRPQQNLAGECTANGPSDSKISSFLLTLVL